jgi:hypothetical protein
MRDSKDIESRYFHTGVVPELIKHFNIPSIWAGNYFG